VTEAVTELVPFERPFQLPANAGTELPLPPDLESIYGPLTFPAHGDRPWVISNFVTTLDGVVSLAVPGAEGGRAISGDNLHDRLLVAMLCAVADAIVIGGGTLRTSPGHIWTASSIAPDFASAFAALRRELGKTGPPLNVVITGHGDIDPAERMFQTGEVPVLVITTEQGAERLRGRGLPEAVPVAVADGVPDIHPRTILNLIASGLPTGLILLEAGPRLTTAFLAARLIDELFLTLSPQIAGRDATSQRPGLAAGHLFAPDDPRWGNLVDIRRAGSHLFLRYALRCAIQDR
jgi:riboflavin biosynthesis pyrimidine reductase